MGKHVNVKRDSNGIEIRNKRTKQYTKEELETAIDVHGYFLDKLKDILNLNDWSLRSQLKKHGLYQDGRKYSNLDRLLNIPDKETLTKMYHDDNLTLLEISKKLGVSNTTVKKWMIEYGIDLLSHSQTISNKVLPKIIQYNKNEYGCDHFFGSDIGKKKVSDRFIEKYGVPYHPIGNTSKAEIDVLNFFNSLHDGFEKNRQFGIELDGYNDYLKIAFEYCGLYWHTESRKGKNLHKKKYDICKENGVRLFTIFEDEWINRNYQVKSFIRSAIGLNECKLFARNLDIVLVDGRDIITNKFIEDHHIQGKPNMNTVLCHFILKDNNEIYSSMSFSKHHRNTNETVLSRYCVKSGYSITGGSSRLFKNAREYFKCKIKTWSDNRWTEGDMYNRLGFNLYKELPIDYSYVGKSQRIPKQRMKKSIILADKSQTEYERALEMGFDRIWDCGKKTWIWE